MAVQPLSPATDRRLGEPLPHQLSNQTQAHLPAASLWRLHHAVLPFHAVLATVSGCYSALEGRLLTRYSPVRHWCISTPVRLECVMHAASVNPEPGSNSLKNSILKYSYEYLKPFSELFYLSFFFYFVMSFSKLFSRFLRTFQCNSEISLLFNFQRPNELAFANSAVLYVAVFCPQVDSLPIIQQSFSKVKPFFKSFSKKFWFFDYRH